MASSSYELPMFRHKQAVAKRNVCNEWDADV